MTGAARDRGADELTALLALAERAFVDSGMNVGPIGVVIDDKIGLVFAKDGAQWRLEIRTPENVVCPLLKASLRNRVLAARHLGLLWTECEKALSKDAALVEEACVEVDRFLKERDA